uniref:Cyanocobalamin reductase (cyanide-eliminating) n=1 Tax=Rhabditophanes sp. KR3021 TaxID=114890 RepID=A0AC35UDJ4_9BILA
MLDLDWPVVEIATENYNDLDTLLQVNQIIGISENAIETELNGAYLVVLASIGLVSNIIVLILILLNSSKKKDPLTRCLIVDRFLCTVEMILMGFFLKLKIIFPLLGMTSSGWCNSIGGSEFCSILAMLCLSKMVAVELLNDLIYSTERIIFGTAMIILVLICIVISLFMIFTFHANQAYFKRFHVFLIYYNLIVVDLMRIISIATTELPLYILTDSLTEKDYTERAVFFIICEMNTLGFLVWIFLISFLTFNRFLTFFTPSVVRKNSLFQIIGFCLFSWIFAIIILCIKLYIGVNRVYDAHDLILSQDYSKLNDLNFFNIKIERFVGGLYIGNPMFLLLLYILSYIKIKGYVNKQIAPNTVPKAYLPSNSNQALVSTPHIIASTSNSTNEINYEALILYQGLFISIFYEIVTNCDYFNDSIMSSINLNLKFYWYTFTMVMNLLLTIVNPVTFYYFNTTANNYLKRTLRAAIKVHSKKLKQILKEEDGFEMGIVDWKLYNESVSNDFVVPFDSDTLGVMVISTPKWFGQKFEPFIRNIFKKENYTKEQFEAKYPSPVDTCLKESFNKIENLFATHSIELINDFDFDFTKKPLVLTAIAGHAAGLAYYYTAKDCIDEIKHLCNSKLIGVGVHTKYGGHFAYRCIILFKDVILKNTTFSKANNFIKNKKEIANLIESFNYNWIDGTFRSIGETPTYKYLQKYDTNQLEFWSTSNRFEVMIKIFSTSST